jgi:hypothetical protein
MSDPLLGKSAPSRLLRERWKSATDLAQELYAMFTATGPREVEGPLTIRVPEGKAAIRVVREEGGRSADGAVPDFGVKKAAPSEPGNAFPGSPKRPRYEPESSRRQGRTEIEPQARRPRDPSHAQADPPARPGSGPPDIEFDNTVGFTKPATFQQSAVFLEPPVVLDRETGELRPVETKRPKMMIGGGSSDAIYGAVALAGQVGPEVSCHLFKNGWASPVVDAATQKPLVVVIQIPVIAEDERIPEGFTFFPVFNFGDGYWSQPPVWG